MGSLKRIGPRAWSGDLARTCAGHAARLPQAGPMAEVVDATVARIANFLQTHVESNGRQAVWVALSRARLPIIIKADIRGVGLLTFAD